MNKLRISLHGSYKLNHRDWDNTVTPVADKVSSLKGTLYCRELLWGDFFLQFNCIACKTQTHSFNELIFPRGLIFT